MDYSFKERRVGCKRITRLIGIFSEMKISLLLLLGCRLHLLSLSVSLLDIGLDTYIIMYVMPQLHSRLNNVLRPGVAS